MTGSPRSVEGSYDARRRHVDLYTAAPSPAARCAAVHCTSGMGHIESFYAVPAPYNEVLLQCNAAPGVVEGGVQKLADASVRGVPTYVLRSGGGAYPTTTTIWVAKDTSLVKQYQEVEQDAGRVTRQTTTVLTFHVVPVAQVPASVFNPPIPAGATVTSHHP